MATRTILVLGATGNQGGATVRSLVKYNEDATSTELPYKILAHTRDASANASKALAALKGVQVVQSGYDALPAIFESYKPIHGVFNSQPPRLENEIELATKVVDLAVAHGVKHMVYTSVAFGEQSTITSSLIEAKRVVEDHIKAQSTMKWTFLRPVVFMTNLAGYDSEMGKIFLTVYTHLVCKPDGPPQFRTQWIAPSDIGYFGALAFNEPENYAGKAIDLAGDSLNSAELEAAFGDAIPEHGTDELLAKAKASLNLSEGYRALFEFLATPRPDGRGPHTIDTDALRKLHPGLKTFKQWLETEVMPQKKNEA